MQGIRSLGNPLTPRIDEIEKFRRQLRFESSHSPGSLSPLPEPSMGDQRQEQENVVAPPITMDAHNKVTIGTYRPALVLSDAARKLEIKGHFIQQLPKFYGMPNEDVLSFMREYLGPKDQYQKASLTCTEYVSLICFVAITVNIKLSYYLCPFLV